jgi:hypothetical protein
MLGRNLRYLCRDFGEKSSVLLKSGGRMRQLHEDDYGCRLQITITPKNATELLALAHKLEISLVTEVVECYLVSQISHENAIDSLLL